MYRQQYNIDKRQSLQNTILWVNSEGCLVSAIKLHGGIPAQVILTDGSLRWKIAKITKRKTRKSQNLSHKGEPNGETSQACSKGWTHSVNHRTPYIVLILFSYNISWQNPLFLHSSHSPKPMIYCFSVSLQKRAALPMISIEYSISKCNKTRHKPLYGGLMKQPRKKKKVRRAGKRIRHISTPTVSYPTKTPS